MKDQWFRIWLDWYVWRFCEEPQSANVFSKCVILQRKMTTMLIPCPKVSTELAMGPWRRAGSRFKPANEGQYLEAVSHDLGTSVS